MCCFDCCRTLEDEKQANEFQATIGPPPTPQKQPTPIKPFAVDTGPATHYMTMNTLMYPENREGWNGRDSLPMADTASGSTADQRAQTARVLRDTWATEPLETLSFTARSERPRSSRSSVKTQAAIPNQRIEKPPQLTRRGAWDVNYSTPDGYFWSLHDKATTAERLEQQAETPSVPTSRRGKNAPAIKKRNVAKSLFGRYTNMLEKQQHAGEGTQSAAELPRLRKLCSQCILPCGNASCLPLLGSVSISSDEGGHDESHPLPAATPTMSSRPGPNNTLRDLFSKPRHGQGLPPRPKTSLGDTWKKRNESVSSSAQFGIVLQL